MSPAKPARTCAWCSGPNEGANPFYCPACVKLHWSKAKPDPPPPPPPKAQKTSTHYHHLRDKPTEFGYQD